MALTNTLAPRMRTHSRAGKVAVTETITPHVTLARFLNCSRAVDGVREKSRRKQTFEKVELKEVAFEMVRELAA